MRIATTLLLFVALHGFSLFEKSRAFRTASFTKRSRSTYSTTNNFVGVCLPLTTDRKFRTISSVDQSTICKIRGGFDGNNGPSSLCGVVRSAGIVVDSIIPSGIFGSINSFFKYYPFIASFLICACKASSADCFAQFMSFKKSSLASRENNNETNDSDATTTSSSRSMSFSFKRNFALLCYGGFYQGCGQALIYNNLFSALFGVGTQPRTVMMKVSFDMLMVQPLVSLPIAYLIKAPIFGYSLADSMRRYVNDVKQQNLLKKCWMVWAPTQIVSFTFIPTHLRISFMACISFFWIILFSSISSSPSSKTENDVISSARIKQ